MTLLGSGMAALPAGRCFSPSHHLQLLSSVISVKNKQTSAGRMSHMDREVINKDGIVPVW